MAGRASYSYLSQNLALIFSIVSHKKFYQRERERADDGCSCHDISSADSQTEIKWNMIVISTQWSAPNWTVS